MATKKQQAAQEREEMREQLREMLPPGSRVAALITHASRSGMSRHVRVFVGGKDDGGRIADLTGMVAVACKLPRARDGWDIVVGGCGFDARFQVVYDLAHALYPDGFGCIGEGCPSNDHSNGDRDYTPHLGCGPTDPRGHRDHWHQAGGYALRPDRL